MKDKNQVWSSILDILEDKITEQSYKTWFSESKPADITDDQMFIKVPSKFIADYLNKNYRGIISEISFSLYDKKYKINFTSKINKKKPDLQEIDLEKPKEPILNDSHLNPKYNFEEFVIGKNNRFAHSASLAIAETPGSSYNPLFIYGESGMGKTHLMQAIGNFILNEVKNKKVYYITTEEFTNEMINAIRNNTMPNFRNKFRNIDALLIDDVHFLSKKEGTQEEFFHTFNALYKKKKQIVLTSDRPPKDIPDLEQRLVTRFEWGLIADLKKPDLETRIAILFKKAESENIILKDKVIEFIAEHIHSNVRALEGSLIRIIAYSSYNNIDTKDITVDIANKILVDMISDKIKEINLETIMHKVCNHYEITPAQIFSKTRKKNIVFPRQVGMYLSNLLIPQLSLKEIANYYKRKDHSTVIHAKKTVEKHFKEDNGFRIEIEKFINKIKR